MITEEIERQLFLWQDAEYRQFQCRLMPNVDPETVIGVRLPLLHDYAKATAKREDVHEFLDTLPHAYYDEYQLHSFIVSGIRDYPEALARTDALLPYINNWAVCDSLSPKAFFKNRAALKGELFRWMDSDRVYTVRFGIEMCMAHYLDEDFDPALPERISRIRSDEYYVNMMTAWYFATALAKQWDAALPYLTDGRLDVWTHNKTIRKARESYRITAECKSYLSSLRVP